MQKENHESWNILHFFRIIIYFVHLNDRWIYWFFAAYIMLPPRCSCSLFIAHAEAARVRICPLFRPHFTTSPTPTLLSPRNNRSLNTCGKSTNSPLKNLFPFFASPPVGAAQIQNRSSASTCLACVSWPNLKKIMQRSYTHLIKISLNCNRNIRRKKKFRDTFPT